MCCYLELFTNCGIEQEHHYEDNVSSLVIFWHDKQMPIKRVQSLQKPNENNTGVKTAWMDNVVRKYLFNCNTVVWYPFVLYSKIIEADNMVIHITIKSKSI